MLLARILPEAILPLDPLSQFMLVMVIILILPRLIERIRLPGLVGLILGGLLLGPKGLRVITPDSHVMHFLADVGKLMVMFFAGLEINLGRFLRTGHKSAVYGTWTFLLPLLAGSAIGMAFGYPWITALLIGSLLASHTLLALPMLIRSNLIRRESITITVGATMFTDIAALVVLAICVAFHTVGFKASILGVRFAGMALYIPLILMGTRWLAPRFLNRMHQRKNSQALLILLLMIVAAVGAEAIHLEGIVGAFIAGLAVGEVIREGAVRERLETFGDTLFVPMFFLIVGTLIDPLSFLRLSAQGFGLVLALIAGLFLMKFLAALIAGRLLRYERDDILCMWSLSLPQVAATLAAALVAYDAINASGQRLIDETTLDAVLILVVITSIAGPILTQRFIKRFVSPLGKTT